MRVKNLKINHVKVYLGENLEVRNIQQSLIDVLGDNKDTIVLDDWYFTKLDKIKAKRGYCQFNRVAGDVKICDYTKKDDSYLREKYGHLVVDVYYFTLSKKIIQNRMNKSVNKYIADKIGQYIALGKCDIKL